MYLPNNPDLTIPMAYNHRRGTLIICHSGATNKIFINNNIRNVGSIAGNTQKVNIFKNLVIFIPPKIEYRIE